MTDPFSDPFSVLGDEAFRQIFNAGRLNPEQEELEQQMFSPPYLFVRNDAVNGFDSLGLWHTSGHHQIYESWLPSSYRSVKVCCCTVDVIGLLERASDELDERTGIGVRYTYMHAMRRPFESVAAARALYDQFLADRRSYAKYVADRAKKGDAFCSDIEAAIWALGEATHAFEDSYSPAHRGFQVWPTNPVRHWQREPDSAIPGTGVVAATKAAFDGDLNYVLKACGN